MSVGGFGVAITLDTTIHVCRAYANIYADVGYAHSSQNKVAFKRRNVCCWIKVTERIHVSNTVTHWQMENYESTSEHQTKDIGQLNKSLKRFTLMETEMKAKLKEDDAEV